MFKKEYVFPLLIIGLFMVIVLLGQLVEKKKGKVSDYVYELRNAVKSEDAELLQDTVFVTHWATWCKPCMKEIPVLSRIAERAYREGASHIGFLAITKQTADDAQKVFENSGLSKRFRCLYEANSVATAINAIREHKNSIPANILIFGDSLVYKGGYTDSTKRKQLENLLF